MSLSMAVRDSRTMLRRDIKHMQRFLMFTVVSAMVPVLFLLLFVYVLGGAIGAGVGGGSYVDYLVPGIIIMCVGAGAGQAATGVATDKEEGIIARFRVMAISRSSVLIGHALGNVIKTMVAITLVIAVAVLIGFRPSADFGSWVATIGMLLLVAFTVSWLAVPLGLAATTPAGANTGSLLIQFLPFISSAFVPTGSMSAGARWFAEHQPYTPITETIRGLLLGTPIGSSGILAICWCVGLTLLGFLWSMRLFNRDPVR